jgi:uncharacterized repeat protein (TIGR02543 family)
MGFALLLFFIVSYENPISTPVNEEVSITSLTSDFKIAPNTTLPEGSNFYNASVASDPDNGFLVTWINTYKIVATRYFHNYACRISKTGEMLDSTAIYLSSSYWPYYCPSAVFARGNWIIAVNQGGLYEWVGAIRLTPSGEVLDDPPKNICDSIGMATILYPIIATNGQEILCVTGIAGKGLYGSIFDSDLNILVDRFLIFKQTVVGSFPRVSAHGNNFFITFLDWQNEMNIKLVIVNPEGQALSTQDVSEDWGYPFKSRGIPTITTLNDISYITYFDESAFWARRYSSDGNPKDSSPVKIVESLEFDLFLEEYSGTLQKEAYTDLVWANESFRFFLPSTPLGISMMSFKTDLSTGNNQPVLLDSQCQLDLGNYMEEESYSLIRASSLGNEVLTAWIDEREGNGRVYGNLFEVTIHQYALTLASGSGGTTDPAPGSYKYDTGTQVSLKATPNTDYRFNQWSGDIPQGHDKDNPLTITMDSDKSITANFIRQYTLTIAAGAGGTTDPSPGTYTYDSGTNIPLKATPDSGYQFSGWSSDASGTTNPITITMDSNKSITANFSKSDSGGGDGDSGKKSPCFIATAAYGSPLHPHLDALRDFRDKYLIPTKVGRAFVNLYYKYSPFVADLIAKHKALKVVVRVSLLPLVAFSYSLLHFGPIMSGVMLAFIFVFTIFFGRLYYSLLLKLPLKNGYRKQTQKKSSAGHFPLYLKR